MNGEIFESPRAELVLEASSSQHLLRFKPFLEVLTLAEGWGNSPLTIKGKLPLQICAALTAFERSFLITLADSK